MGKLTESLPKSMLRVAGKNLIEHKLDALPPEVNEVILVVGYLGSVIRDYFGDEYNGKKILYVEQKNPMGGTAEALWLAKDLLHEKFFVMNGDNIFSAGDMAECMRNQWAVLVEKRASVRTGAVVTDAGGRVTSITENTGHSGKEGFANTGLYVLDTRVFDYQPISKAPGSKELGLPQTFIQATKNVHIQAVQAHLWVEIKEPVDLEKAEEILAKKQT